jgi:hypothetical protein
MADQPDVDPSLVVRVSSLSQGSQRWLKMAIQAIRSTDIGDAKKPEAIEMPSPRKPSRLQKPAANLEDVITGKADLREQLDSYPELSNELEGLADVIDLLREAGERRRKRGGEILRELLEGEEERTEDDGAEDDQPRRPRR